jgi:TatD DNase family protein
MHAFSGTLEEYWQARECGDFVFGIGGVVTYKKSPLAAVVADMRLSEIVLETDSPYLPPVPHRGKRNESAYLSLICEKIAEIKGFLPEEVAASTTANAERIFKY